MKHSNLVDKLALTTFDSNSVVLRRAYQRKYINHRFGGGSGAGGALAAPIRLWLAMIAKGGRVRRSIMRCLQLPFETPRRPVLKPCSPLFFLSSFSSVFLPVCAFRARMDGCGRASAWHGMRRDLLAEHSLGYHHRTFTYNPLADMPGTERTTHHSSLGRNTTSQILLMNTHTPHTHINAKYTQNQTTRTKQHQKKKKKLKTTHQSACCTTARSTTPPSARGTRKSGAPTSRS